MNSPDPIAMVVADRERARAEGDPLADISFLATVTPSGNAAVRALVLREIRENRLALFLNRTSPKWHELQHAGGYELLLYYPSVGRQYRLSGQFEEIERDHLVAHWSQRPPPAKYLDHLYAEGVAQSTPVASRAWLLGELEALRGRFPDPDAMSATLEATGIECIITRVDLLHLVMDGGVHERTLFNLVDGEWEVEPLVP